MGACNYYCQDKFDLVEFASTNYTITKELLCDIYEEDYIEDVYGSDDYELTIDDEINEGEMLLEYELCDLTEEIREFNEGNALVMYKVAIIGCYNYGYQLVAVNLLALDDFDPNFELLSVYDNRTMSFLNMQDRYYDDLEHDGKDFYADSDVYNDSEYYWDYDLGIETLDEAIEIQKREQTLINEFFRTIWENYDGAYSSSFEVMKKTVAA